MEYPKPSITITSLQDVFSFLHEFVKKEYQYTYRGVGSEHHYLIPSVGRIRSVNNKVLTVDEEKKILESFRKRAFPFLKDMVHDLLTLLTIGQHHGLPTRLLDWTPNPLMALYFAVEFETDEQNQSCVYVLDVSKKQIRAEKEIKDPFNIIKVERFIPYHWDTRITAQAGQFTIHPNPAEPWDGDGNLKRVLISPKIRKEVKGLLDKFGINAATVYPDLDGVAKHVKWMKSNVH